MKKLLLGSSALIAVAAFAASANAAEKIKLSIGGYYAGAAAYVDTSDVDPAGVTDTRDYTFGSDSEIHFKGMTVLDNGLQVGFTVEFELERDNVNSDEVDEVFVELKGGFGEIEFGQQDGAAEQLYVAAPNVFKRIVLQDADMSPTENVYGFAVDVMLEESDDNTKISYFTPRIAGFQAGASFTPERAKNDQLFNGVTESAGDEIFEAGVNFKQEFNEVSIGGSLGYLTADGGTGDEPTFWSASAQIGFAGFTLGGGYSEKEDYAGTGLSGSSDNGSANTSQNYEVGATYAVGPWVFGLGYASEELETVSGAELEENTKILGGVAYNLGPGIQIGLGFESSERDTTATSVADREGTAVFTELGLNF